VTGVWRYARGVRLPAFAFLIASAPVLAAAEAPVVWVEVVGDTGVAKADVERAAGALRAGVRGAGAVVAPDAKSAERKITAHLSESGEDFALRIDTTGAEPASAASGPLVLLEDGAKRLGTRAASLTGKIAVPPDAKAEWFVDGKKAVPEAGTTITVARGTHAVRAQSGSGQALAVVDVAGGETVPFPRAALAALSGTVATPAAIAALSTPAPAATPVAGLRQPALHPAARSRGWLWAGLGGAALLVAGGAAVALSQPAGSSGTTTKTSGNPYTDVTLHP